MVPCTVIDFLIFPVTATRTKNLLITSSNTIAQLVAGFLIRLHVLFFEVEYRTSGLQCYQPLTIPDSLRTLSLITLLLGLLLSVRLPKVFDSISSFLI